MRDLQAGTLADLHTLTAHPPTLRRGHTELIKPANPAANTSHVHQVDPAWWERILAVTASVHSSGTNGLRSLSLDYADADGFVFDSLPLLGTSLSSVTTVGYADQSAPAQAAPSPSLSIFGTSTDPAANTAIAELFSVQPGTYQVVADVFVSGTVTAADGANMQIICPGLPNVVIAYPGVAGVLGTVSIVITLLASGNVSITNPVAASGAAAVYNASLTATPIAGKSPRSCLPDVMLKPHWSLTVNATGLQTNDQITNIGILTEKYPSNWADGALGADEERQARWLAEAIAEGRIGL